MREHDNSHADINRSGYTMRHIHSSDFENPIVGILFCIAAFCFAGKNSFLYVLGAVIGAIAYCLQVKTFFHILAKKLEAVFPCIW